MGIDEIGDVVRPLRGAPASILLSLHLRRRPLTNRELQHSTGFSDKIVKDGVRILIRMGFVEAFGDSGPWQLASGVHALGLSLPDGYSVPASENSVTPHRDSVPVSGDSVPSSGNSVHGHGDFVPPSTRSSKNLEELEPVSPQEKLVLAKEENLEAEENPAEIPASESPTRKPATTPARIPAREPAGRTPAIAAEVRPDFASNRKAALEAGIHDPAASRLAKLRHVTPEFINEHVRRVLAESQQLGLAIFRIEHNFTLPAKSRPDWPPILVNPEDPRPPEYQPASTEPTVWDHDENFHTLMEYRGAEDVAKRIAALPHVTPHFIREHMRQAALHRQDVITALYRIQNNEPLPETWIYGLDSKESPDAGIRQLAEELNAAHKRPR